MEDIISPRRRATINLLRNSNHPTARTTIKDKTLMPRRKVRIPLRRIHPTSSRLASRRRTLRQEAMIKDTTQIADTLLFLHNHINSSTTEVQINMALHRLSMAMVTRRIKDNQVCLEVQLTGSADSVPRSWEALEEPSSAISLEVVRLVLWEGW